MAGGRVDANSRNSGSVKVDNNKNDIVYSITEANNEKENTEKFSFEKDFLEVNYKKMEMYGFVQDKYFIDIGIPADYERAQKEFLNRDYSKK